MMFKGQAQVETEKAARYLKALCNHFSHKVTAQYNDNHGSVQFSIGTCELDAEGNKLTMRVAADDAQNLERLKHVMADHLTRFSGDDALKVEWTKED